MVSRGLLVALVALALLVGGAYWSEKAKTAEEAKPPKDAPPKLLAVPEDQIQKVEIHKQGYEPTVLERDKAQHFQITAPKPLNADLQDTAAYMSALTGLVWDRLVEDKATDLATYGLATPALQIILTMKDGKTHKLLLGDATPTGGDVFGKLGADARVFTVADSAKNSLDKASKDLRDKRLLTFDSEKLSRVEVAAKGQSVELGKNAQNEWQIIKPKPYRADGFQVEEIVRRLKEAKMDPAVTDEDAKKTAAAYAAAPRSSIVKVTDNAGTQQIEIHKNAGDKTYYAKSSVVEGVYKIATDAGEGLEKGLDDLRNRKLFDFGFNEPSKVEVHDGDKTFLFTKSGDKWSSGGKQMDAAGFQMLVDKLRDMTALKFVEKPFPAASTLEATVTSGDGKKVERVVVAKSGDSFLAKRDAEPPVYEVDGKVVDEIRKAAADVKPAPPAKAEAKK
ncbi:MAG: DUF4340 domain-containing protein [Bryobacteraceae bacterium]